jgi:hypothetical protein
MAGVVFAKYAQVPMYYVPLGVAAVVCGVSEALLSFGRKFVRGYTGRGDLYTTKRSIVHRTTVIEDQKNKGGGALILRSILEVCM